MWVQEEKVQQWSRNEAPPLAQERGSALGLVFGCLQVSALKRAGGSGKGPKHVTRCRSGLKARGAKPYSLAYKEQTGAGQAEEWDCDGGIRIVRDLGISRKQEKFQDAGAEGSEA